MTVSELGFDDALRIARGCTDYGGGYRNNVEQFEIYQNGIATVIRSLEAALKEGLGNYQVAVLHAMGAPITDAQLLALWDAAPVDFVSALRYVVEHAGKL